MVQLLLDAGANAKLRTANGEDVLERYGFWNDPVLVRMLLERGIDPATKDTRGQNAQLFAAASDTLTPEVFALLLNGEAPPMPKRHTAMTRFNWPRAGAMSASQRSSEAPFRPPNRQYFGMSHQGPRRFGPQPGAAWICWRRRSFRRQAKGMLLMPSPGAAVPRWMVFAPRRHRHSAPC